MARLNTKTLRAELAYFQKYMREDGKYDYKAETAILVSLCRYLQTPEKDYIRCIEVVRRMLPGPDDLDVHL